MYLIPKPKMKTHIFYHLYIADTPVWQDILKVQFDSIVNSGLYDEVNTIYFGIVYTKEADLSKLSKFTEKYDKIKILYKRHKKSFPIKIWSNPNIEIKTQLGEGETILKMIEFAKQNKSDNYLFMHSKGSTNPNSNCRSQKDYFLHRGMKPFNNDNWNRTLRRKFNDFILLDIKKEIIEDWRTKLKILENNDFYYYIFNFFYATGDFLSKFDFKKYNEKGCFPLEFTLKDRHWSAMFPVNLYGVINNLKLLTHSKKDNIFIETRMVDVGTDFDLTIQEYVK